MLNLLIISKHPVGVDGACKIPAGELADDDAQSTGVRAEQDEEQRKNAGVCAGDEREQLDGCRYPSHNRAPPKFLDMQFFRRAEDSPGDPTDPGLNLNYDIENDNEGLILAHLFMQFLLMQGLQNIGKMVRN